MKIILLGNYSPDQQESMKRYAINLHLGLGEAGISSEIWYPIVFFAKGQKSTISGFGKWLGYIDKWLLFPLIIKLRLLTSGKTTYFHVCDHSNSPYLAYLPAERCGITCHDVLAIRGALGYQDAYCPASPAGKILQKWILGNLKTAKRLVSVSNFTLSQLQDLSGNMTPNNTDKNWKVIHNSFNASFWPMDKQNRRKYLEMYGPKLNDEGFILHVGSSLPRKNRSLLLEMAKKMEGTWNGYICFAGEPIDQDLKILGDTLGLTERIVSIEHPDHYTLVALYSACKAFVFPSFSEGFGWPIIEAQACGVPVLTSNLEPMLEVSDGSAIHADPSDSEDFARAFLKIMNNEERTKIILKGYDNCKRFDTASLMKEFIKMYEI